MDNSDVLSVFFEFNHGLYMMRPSLNQIPVFTGKSMFSCRFSPKPIHCWSIHMVLSRQIFADTERNPQMVSSQFTILPQLTIIFPIKPNKPNKTCCFFFWGKWSLASCCKNRQIVYIMFNGVIIPLFINEPVGTGHLWKPSIYPLVI